MYNPKNWSLVIGHWSLRKQGFSLVELVFAMSFLAIIILGVISLQTSNLAMMNSQNNVIQAHFYANQGLQIVEALGYSYLDGQCPSKTCKIQFTDPSYGIDDEGGSPEEIDGLFQRSFELLNPDDLLADTNQVIMNVKWTDSTGDHEVTAKRIIY